jgi:hypothetical protein
MSYPAEETPRHIPDQVLLRWQRHQLLSDIPQDDNRPGHAGNMPSHFSDCD